MKYKKRIISGVIILAVVLCAAYAFESYFEILRLENKIIRLHILANSDTLQDQELKLRVRNNIISSYNKKLGNLGSKKESEKYILNSLKDIKQIAQQTVYEEGYYYNVEVYYGNYEFPIREYEGFTLPKGEYDAVRVEIGEAKGKNWWCVMFPPLCFMDAGKIDKVDELDEELVKKLSEVLTQEEIEIIRTNRGYSKIKLKSKLYEIVSEIINK